MISVEIEKEIDQENKVILDLNLRQIICVIILVIFGIFSVVILKLDSEILPYPILALGALLWAFGWGDKMFGMPFEKMLIKKIQAEIYKSNTRKYKTKNQYVVMVNEEYSRRKNIDMTNKNLRKEIQREQKEVSKMLKEAEKNSVCKPVL